MQLGTASSRYAGLLLAGVLAINCALPSPAQAQAICLYILLVSEHTATAICGDTLAPEAEARYQAAIARLAVVVVRTTPGLKGQDPQEWSEKIQRTHRERARPDVCKSQYYPVMKSMMIRWSNPDSAAKID